ncbi:MAG: DUF3078 domain-containing protein [Bacteroidota bacterium]
MKNYILICFSFFVIQNTQAQDPTIVDLKKITESVIKKDPADSIPKIWSKGVNFSLNIGQSALNNWSAGGDDFSFSLNSYLNLFAFYKKDKISWDNGMQLLYGVMQTSGRGRRKTGDRIDFSSKYGYSINNHINLAGLVNVRSQFSNGYKYKKDEPDAPGTLTSRPFTPTYIILSLGLDYKRFHNFSFFISPLSARWVIVSDRSLGSTYGLDSGKIVKKEFGAFASIKHSSKIAKNIELKSKMDFFSNYLYKPGNIDITLINILTAKINSHINFNFNLEMIYDNDTQNVDPTKGPAPQWLQLMGIGVAYKFDN